MRLGQHGPGKMQGQIILPQHGKHIHALRIRSAEDFHNFTFGIAMAGFPFAEFDHHLVPHPRGPAHIARWCHINIVRNARVVGNDIEKLFALLQRADDLGAAAFQNPHHRAVLLVPGAEIFPAHLAPHQHTILMQRRTRGAFGNGDFFQRRIIRL